MAGDGHADRQAEIMEAMKVHEQQFFSTLQGMLKVRFARFFLSP
jgi:hypothetical protein